jgi:hypothetical protein
MPKVTADDRRVRMLSAAIGLYYAVLGLFILTPESVYSGDIGVQYVQAQSILDHRFRSLDISYPGEFLDPERRFFPIRPPYVLSAGGTTQSIFPPASAAVQAIGVSAFGLRGMVIISVLAGWATLYCAARIAPPRARTAVLIVLGFASPLWFYAVSGWHHAAGMAFGSASFMVALTGSGRLAPFLAGLSLGAGAALRDEVVLLVPGVAFALWMRERTFRPILLLVGGALAALACAAAVDVWWFDRPAAAHVRHAVHLLQRALQTTDAPNMDVPILHPMTLKERHQTVVQYWLFGYGNDALLAAYVAGLLAAWVLHWKLRSSKGIGSLGIGSLGIGSLGIGSLGIGSLGIGSLGVVIWLVAVLWPAGLDFLELIARPKWLAGLHRVAPYLVFAALPRPVSKSAGSAADDLIVRVGLVSTAAYLVVAFAGVDTTGGKGLGPRLLLPLLPILTVGAVLRISAYLRGSSVLDRWAGRIGGLLVIMTLVIHGYATTFAYYARNRDDASVILAVAASRERIVIADDAHTAQLLFPLYYRKIVFLADSPDAASALASMLARNRLSGALLVSRDLDGSVTLPGLRVAESKQVGRMSITHWAR